MQGTIMETTITLEFTSDTHEHLKTLEHQLKHIHDVHVLLVEPQDHTAPTLVAISITRGGERGVEATRAVSHTLYQFLHEGETGVPSQKKLFLVTIEGDRIDIEPLAVEAIEGIIREAEAE